MVNSMTGFGRATVAIDGREMTVELKSVNHRYLDVSYRMPRHIGFVEDVFRTALSSQLARGHVDVFVNYRNTRTDARKVEVDAALLGEYLTAARCAGEQYGLRDDLTLSNVLRLPDVTDVVEAEENREAVSNLALATLNEAAAELKQMRALEGGRLTAVLLERADVVLSLAERIKARAPMVVEEYRARLTERIETLLNAVEVDRARLATEVALFADRASIDEELDRLLSHMTQLRLMLNSDEPAGRKLDFIVQEMNREFNTIGSKANDGEITELVILGKAEVEKIREQVQNIE